MTDWKLIDDETEGTDRIEWCLLAAQDLRSSKTLECRRRSGVTLHFYFIDHKKKLGIMPTKIGGPFGRHSLSGFPHEAKDETGPADVQAMISPIRFTDQRGQR